MQTPFVMIIFGSTGDLARNKLFPSLFSLFSKGQLGKKFFIVGFSRKDFSNEQFRIEVKNYLKVNDKIPFEDFDKFSENLFYQQGLFDQENDFKKLIQLLADFDRQTGACITRFFYLATPPDSYQVILDNLETTKLSEGCGQGSNKWTRVIIEKPFGKNLEHAKMLDEKLAKIFEEKQIFRVDHYLGKETVQNILAFRFANGVFEPVWNNKYVDHVQITLAEEKGIGLRGKFFDGVGILRDVGQNHLMQLLASVAMESPSSFSKEAVRDQRAKVIQALKHIEPERVNDFVVRGQYKGYKDEKDVSKDSETETFVVLKTFINNHRFSGVPFYLRIGKKMPKTSVTISIVFIQTCHVLFKEFGCPEIGNVLTINVQPDEGIKLKIIAKKPGDKLALSTVDLKFSYQEEFGTKGNEAYEKIMLDILEGDQMLFNRSDELEHSWEFIGKILQGWEKHKNPLPIYNSKDWGPNLAMDLIARDGRKWID